MGDGEETDFARSIVAPSHALEMLVPLERDDLRAGAKDDRGALLDPHVTDSVLEWMRGGGQLNKDPLTRLSEQERRILPLIALGKTNRQIGAMLYLSEHTVKSYVSSLLKKLELARRSEAAAYVARHDHTWAS